MTLKLVSGGAPAPEKGATAWAVRLDRGELDDAETKAFEHWLGEPGNPEAYAEAAAAMHVFDGLDLGLPELVALREEALGAAALAQAEVPSARPPVMRRWMPWAGSALAASIVAALLLRSEEHTSELQSLMRISYAIFCLTKKTKHYNSNTNTKTTTS